MALLLRLARAPPDSALLAGPGRSFPSSCPLAGTLRIPQDREALAKALADSRLFTEAVIVVKDARTPDGDRVSQYPGRRT
jgi:hypothetical protein